jgi:HEAT repeat protein
MAYVRIVKWLSVLSCAVACCASAVAEPLDLQVDRGRAESGEYDYDFPWLYWWELNGQAYLREAIGERELPVDAPSTRRFSRDAIAALIPMLDDDEPRVREQAVLALARIGFDRLEIALIGQDGETRELDPRDSAWMIDDPSVRVRSAAWLAMGLLETERTRAYLAQPIVLPEVEQASRVAAIGLLTELDDDHLAALTALLIDPDTSQEVKRWVVWAVDRHDASLPTARREAVYRWALDNVASPFVLIQLLRSTDYIRRSGGVDRLMQVIRYYPSVREWPGYDAIRAMPAGLSHGSSVTRVGMETRVAAVQTLAELQPPDRPRERAELRETLIRRAMAGNRGGELDFNRGADTIAFALMCDATPEDLAVLYDLLRGFTVLPPDQADPSIPREELNEMDLLLRQATNPVRGYAAIAVGLLIRRETEGTALYDAWTGPRLDGIELERLKRRFGERLARAIADEDEPMGYRVACALALGLTADPRYIPELTEELGRLQAGDEAVLGYGLLSLAMLGETRAAETVKRYVTRLGGIVSTEDLIGRRAALQALAVLGERGGSDTREVLSRVWGRDPWLSIEVARTTHWSGLYDEMPEVLTSTRSASMRWRVAAAMSLGAALDRDFPPRIEALAEGGVYAMSYRWPEGYEPEAEEEPARPRRPGVIRLPPRDSDEAEDAGPPPTPLNRPPGWPIREIPAYGNPFLFERLMRP